ncbi:hypothetical protein E2F48_16310 [Arthrobacter crusticola]|uniref:Uncharacterized protein n=1 Tax=Arthrobacter crusticola TaxID=2547960 RepID=A0A4R5TLV4_9MICC|nr:DUF6541 family protein [Arthrobacter crusticola]TDK23547.1 hypothetical protein E2F48_16310 [Arthrobacter crusticola]
MSWWDTAPAFVLVISILLLPGALIALAAGARGASVIAAAPALGVGLVGLSGIAGGLLGIRWTLWWVGVCAVVVILLSWVFGRYVGPRGPRQRFVSQWPGLIGLISGAVFAAAVIGQQLKFAIDRPDHIAQRYDNVFHLNAVRYILESDNASTLTLGRMLLPTNTVAIYPSAWHSIVALITDGAGLEIPVASNVMNIAVAAVVWPLSCMFLSSVVFGARWFPLAVTGVLSTCFAAFPLALFDWGPLFPNLLSYAALPVAIGYVAALCRLSQPTGMSVGGLAIGLVGGCAALGTAQPNGLVALMAFFIPMGLWAWIRWFKGQSGSRTKRSILTQVAVLIGSAGAIVLAWYALLLGYDDRDPFTTGGAALGEALTGTASSTETTWMLAAAILIGVVVLIRQPRWAWILGCFAVAAALYVVVASEPRGPVRMTLTGAWYQDAPRLAALLPLVSVMVAVAGLVWLVDRSAALVGALRGTPAWLGKVASVVVGAAVVGVLIPSAFSDGMEASTQKVSKAFSFDPKYTDILTLDERTLIARLPDLVGKGSVIGVNPWNGGALAYSYTGIKVSQYHMTDPDKVLALVAQSADEANAGSAVCVRARELGIDYVLDFGSDYLLDFDNAFLYPAFDDAGDSKYTLVDQVGAAKLFKLGNCFEVSDQ